MTGIECECIFISRDRNGSMKWSGTAGSSSELSGKMLVWKRLLEDSCCVRRMRWQIGWFRDRLCANMEGPGWGDGLLLELFACVSGTQN